MKHVLTMILIVALGAPLAAQTKDGDRGSDGMDDTRGDTHNDTREGREESGRTTSAVAESTDLNALGINWQHEIDQADWITTGTTSQSGNIVLKRGYTSNDDIFLWRYSGTGGMKSVSGYKFGTPVTQGWVCNDVTGICTCEGYTDCMDLIIATQ